MSSWDVITSSVCQDAPANRTVNIMCGVYTISVD